MELFPTLEGRDLTDRQNRILAGRKLLEILRECNGANRVIAELLQKVVDNEHALLRRIGAGKHSGDIFLQMQTTRSEAEYFLAQNGLLNHPPASHVDNPHR